MVILLWVWVCVPAEAGIIDPKNPSQVRESLGLALQDKRFITAPLIDFSPFPAHNKIVVPGFVDPLGTGVDPGMRIFSGKVHYMDVLGNFNVTKPRESVDIELPPGSLAGINLLDDVFAMYLSYNGRAFDKSILNLKAAEVVVRNGLPVTSETSPLSLAGFGSVSENLKPFYRHWTRCPNREKIELLMAESIKKGKPPCSVPGSCQCFVI